MSEILREIPARAPTYHHIRDLATAEWGLTIKHTDYEKLLGGFKPRSMDDKWLCISDAPDARGNMTIHWYRSWGHVECYKVLVEVQDPNQTEGNDWAKLSNIAWEKILGGLEVSEEEAKEDVVDLCRNFVGCEFGGAGTASRAE
ncbi:hypothetical protein PMIN06_012141 [Paraphaeosphaeria minitans]|uniref:Uncharacterized protein n=1 Tax=Paraphaeosphaeria minitans TaxID=565426 RepID=A0A9P6GCF1_9PLEO|nr:hypothetical protein PMIN01_10676 [Paraphaeosphaeria minitans]